MKRTPGRLSRLLVHSGLFALSCAAVLACPVVLAQTGPGGGMKGALQQKLADIKASTSANQEKLHQYMWTETSTITANGRELPPRVSTCFYGPDGKVHKEPVGDTGDASSGGRRRGPLMQRVMAKKKAEMKDYMQQVGRLVKLYVPPTPQRMQAALEARKVSFSGGNGSLNLAFRDYALHGDSMTIDFDPAQHAIRSLRVNTYLDTPDNPVTLKVDFATLPDGTHHPSRTTLDAHGQEIVEVVSVNSNYRKSSQN